MKLLILSSHSILEYDDLRLFSSLGIDVFIPGSYSDPRQANQMRPALPDAPYHPELEDLMNAQRHLHRDQPVDFGIVDWGKADLHPELIDWADVIMVNCFPDAWIGGQWDAIRHKRVIWRTIGQSDGRGEWEMRQFANQGLQIVRYSPAEKRAFEPLGVFAGEDAMIRFAKDPADYGPWIGDERVVGNVSQNLDVRGDHCGYGFWQEATAGLPTKPAGLGSERLPNGTGHLSWDELRAYLSHIRCFLYMGTQPASYTLALMEAMLAGVPVVSIGPEDMWMPALFEGHELVTIGTAFPSSEYARIDLQLLLDDMEYAHAIGRMDRAKAIRLFGIDAIREQWRDFLGLPRVTFSHEPETVTA